MKNISSPKNNAALRFFLIFIILSFFVSSNSYPAEKADTERLIKQMTAPTFIVEGAEAKKDQMLVDSFFEYSNISQGATKGHWWESTNRFGYTHKNIQGYLSLSQFNRLGNNDYVVNAGSYLNFDNAYAHIEAGFGGDVDFIYKFQSILEYGHRLYKDVYWQLGYSYRNYQNSGDTSLVYPGLIYYFGDNYLSANYGVSMIEGRGAGNFGTVRGNFTITKFLQFWSGAAFGQWLYDIYGFPASKENGYILFAGTTFNIYKDIDFRVGYSYGAEKPNFIKRSVDFDLTVKF